MEETGQRHTPAALLPEKNRSTQGIGKWAGPRCIRLYLNQYTGIGGVLCYNPRCQKEVNGQVDAPVPLIRKELSAPSR
jgi:hypothetical protein